MPRTTLSRLSSVPHLFAVRLVAAMLLVSVPLMIGLAWFLTSASSSDLTEEAEANGESTARSVTLNAEAWLGERQEHLDVIAVQAAGLLGKPALKNVLAGVAESYDDYTAMQITDLAGNVLASSHRDVALDTEGKDWFRVAAAGRTALTSITRRGNDIDWILARPVLNAAGETEGVIAADLNAVELPELSIPSWRATPTSSSSTPTAR